jgi:hypothetical protein
MVLKLIIFVGLLISATIISFQDFKARLLSVWVVLFYSLCCVALVLYFQSSSALLSNLISALLYFGFILFVLFLFYFLKEGKFVNIIDTKIGTGDLIVFLAIGVTLDLLNLILFFTVSFMISAVIGLFLAKRDRTVPLAGILTCCHFIFMTFVLNSRPV